MSEKLKDTAIDLLLDGVKKKIDDMRDNHKWQELFVNTGHFFINNSDMVTRFESGKRPIRGCIEISGCCM